MISEDLQKRLAHARLSVAEAKEACSHDSLSLALSECIALAPSPLALAFVADLAAWNFYEMPWMWELKRQSVFALLHWQCNGIDTISEIAPFDPRPNELAIFAPALAAVAAGLAPNKAWHFFADWLPAPEITLEMQKHAWTALRQFLSSANHLDIISVLTFQLSFVYEEEIAEVVVLAMASRWYTIGPRVLNKYRKLIESQPDDEPTFQAFFSDHPQLLDPYAREVWTQPDLHGKLRPDFILQRMDGGIVVVEIETPAKRLINRNGGLSAHANEGIRQVLEYHDYLLNLRTGPFCNAPSIEMLAVIGMESPFTAAQTRALVRENRSRQGLRIIGFDGLANRAEQLELSLGMFAVEVHRGWRHP